jgi:protein subunit release factor A
MKIEIRAAEGGEHAERIVKDITKAYLKYLDSKN